MLPAAAAGIAFAAEANVTARGEINVLQFNSISGAKPTVFSTSNTNDDRYEWDNGGFKFDFSGEKAGGSFVVDGWSHGNSPIESMTVWCKPIDMLKLSIGDQNVSSNQESIDWSKIYDNSTKGFGISLYPVDGFSFDFIVGKDGYGAWLENDVISKVLAKASYSADFGTAFAFFGFQGETRTLPAGTHYGYYTEDGDSWKYGIVNAAGSNVDALGEEYEATKNKDGKVDFGAGFSGSAGPISFFADVLATIKPQADKAFDNFTFDAFASFSQDALTAKAYVKAAINPNKEEEEKTDIGFMLKGEYNLGLVTPYVEIKSGDVIAKDGNIGLVIQPGFTTNVGECAIDVSCNATIKSAGSATSPDIPFQVSVPVTFKVKF